VCRTAVLIASYGRIGSRRLTAIPFGTVTLSLHVPGPVTEIQPSPEITTSWAAFFHESPEIYEMKLKKSGREGPQI
jgi:hypothetical protein